MRRRGWPLIVVAFGGLICLMILAGTIVYRYVGAVQAQIDRTQEDYVRRNQVLGGLRTDILSLAIELRDYLLNSAPSSVAEQRPRMFKLRDSILTALDETGRLIGPEDPDRVRHLRSTFDGYWGSVEVVLRWTPNEIRAKAPAFLLQRALPSRDALLAVMG